MKIWRKRIDHSINQLISHEAVYRTAPATPGLSIIFGTVKKSKLPGATVLKHRSEQQQTKSFGQDEHQM